MAVTTPTKTSESKELAPAKGQKLAPSADFPFFLSALRGEFEQMFERMMRNLPALWEHNGWRWGLDVEDQDEAVVVRAEAPGFEPGDFDLQIRGNELVMRASRKQEKKAEGMEERRQQECYQSVTLPTGIDADKVTAKYRNGVLTVTLPKTLEGKGKRIAIKGA